MNKITARSIAEELGILLTLGDGVAAVKFELSKDAYAFLDLCFQHGIDRAIDGEFLEVIHSISGKWVIWL
jgi:magnesium-transporting ATPase (P-type)